MTLNFAVDLNLIIDNLALISNVVQLYLQCSVLVFNHENCLFHEVNLLGHSLSLFLQVFKFFFVQQVLLLSGTFI